MMFAVSVILLLALAGAVRRNCHENVVIAIDQARDRIIVEAYNVNGNYTDAEGPTVAQLAVQQQLPATADQCDQFLQGFDIVPDPLRPHCMNDTRNGFHVCAGQHGLDDNDAPLTYAVICNTDAMFYLRIDGSNYSRALAIYQNASVFQGTPEAQVPLVPNSARILLAKMSCSETSSPAPPSALPSMPQANTTAPNNTITPVPSSNGSNSDLEDVLEGQDPNGVIRRASMPILTFAAISLGMFLLL